MVEEKCLLRIEKEVRIMRGETHLKYGDMTVDVVKSENANGNINLYVATIRLRNKLGEIFYEDVQELDMSGKDWEYYKEFLYEVVMTKRCAGECSSTPTRCSGMVAAPFRQNKKWEKTVSG